MAAERKSAEAGHWGKEIRSDLHVAIEPRDSGGIELGLESRVAPYYGDAILAQARQVLEVLGVKHARVSIHDEGALPYVIAARMETAARRAGVAGAHKALPERIALPAPSATLPSGHRTQVCDQRGTARAGRDHSRPGRLGSSGGERCGANPCAQHAAGGQFRRVRADGANQPASARPGRPGGGGPGGAGPDSDSEGRASRTGHASR